MRIKKNNDLLEERTKLFEEIAKLKQARELIVQEMRDNALNLSHLNESKIELEKTIEKSLELSDELANEANQRILEYKQVIESYIGVLEMTKKEIDNAENTVKDKKGEFDALCLSIEKETTRIGKESANLERWRNDIDIYKSRVEKIIKDKGLGVKLILE